MIHHAEHRVNPCHPYQLKKLLDGSLPVDEEAIVVAHLDQCLSCRCRLEELAAGPDAWQSASDFLKADSLDLTTDSTWSRETEEVQPLISQVLGLLQPTDDPEMLGRVGGFEISGVVGAGGMGVVLKAHDRSLDRTVAIKVMAPHLATSGAARQRFSREARAAAAVIHPNVIAIHAVATETSMPYLVMPYIAGCSLQRRIDNEGALPLEDVLRIGAQIASGLAAAHDQGLVHRDIKPANILLEQGVDRLVITDFGLARAVDDAGVTRTGVIAGTPQFMSPEQARGEALDARSDLFSLGSVLYALCTGRVPFRAESALAVLRRITDEFARPIQEINPAIPWWLCQIIDRLHGKSPTDRYESAHRVAELLTRCLAHVSQPNEHSLPMELQRHRNRYVVFEGGLFRKAALIAGLFVFSILIAVVAWRNIALFDTEETPRKQTARDDDTEASFSSKQDDKLFSTGTAHANDAVSTRPLNTTASPGLPWEKDRSKQLDWDDELAPVFRHIEQSLQNIDR